MSKRAGSSPSYVMHSVARSGDRRDGTRLSENELIYGRNAVREALRAQRRQIFRLLVADGTQTSAPIIEIEALADNAGIPVAYGDRHVLDDMLEGVNHQGVALETGPYPYSDLDDILKRAEERGEPPLLLLLDHLQDPQNIGTLLRTAEVVGVHGVFIPNRRAAGITPSVVNASSGAVEHLLIAQITNLAQTIQELKEQQIWVAGLEDDARAEAFDRIDLAMAVALVIGAEGDGLARLVRDRCDLLIRLPMAGQIASLNAATAGSIALYHLWRQRTAAEGKSKAPETI